MGAGSGASVGLRECGRFFRNPTCHSEPVSTFAPTGRSLNSHTSTPLLYLDKSTVLRFEPSRGLRAACAAASVRQAHFDSGSTGQRFRQCMRWSWLSNGSDTSQKRLVVAVVGCRGAYTVISSADVLECVEDSPVNPGSRARTADGSVSLRQQRFWFVVEHGVAAELICTRLSGCNRQAGLCFQRFCGSELGGSGACRSIGMCRRGSRVAPS